jgi:hypothetical protein
MALKGMLIPFLSIVLFLGIGVLHLVYAARIAQWYRNYYTSRRFLKSALMIPFRAWVESRFYETWMRVFGVLMILVGLLVAFVMIRGLLGYAP